MTLYFCIDDLLSALERSGIKAAAMAEVHVVLPSCTGGRDDAFVIASTPSMLDLDSGGQDRLSSLLEECPLYHINTELALDRALLERHRNSTVRIALERAFDSQELPTTLATARPGDEEGMTGSLHHPVLGHLEVGNLCRIYLSFIRELGASGVDYGFYGDIIGRHPEIFLDHYDGYLLCGKGAVRTEILLRFGARADHEPGKPLESYMEAGAAKARAMRLAEPREQIWAWLEADHFQMRRCRDIHRLLSLPDLPKRPGWLKTDIFCLLEREAMKQVFSEMITASADAKRFLDKLPLVKKAVQDSAAGRVDECLQALLSQALNAGTPYAGAAGKFAAAAQLRDMESQEAR